MKYDISLVKFTFTKYAIILHGIVIRQFLNIPSFT